MQKEDIKSGKNDKQQRKHLKALFKHYGTKEEGQSPPGGKIAYS